MDVSINMAPVVNAHGIVIGATKVARNISARKLGELAQRSSEVRWRSVVDSAVVDGLLELPEALLRLLSPAPPGQRVAQRGLRVGPGPGQARRLAQHALTTTARHVPIRR